MNNVVGAAIMIGVMTTGLVGIVTIDGRNAKQEIQPFPEMTVNDEVRLKAMFEKSGMRVEAEDVQEEERYTGAPPKPMFNAIHAEG